MFFLSHFPSEKKKGQSAYQEEEEEERRIQTAWLKVWRTEVGEPQT